MSAMQNFNFEGAGVRTLVRDEEPWFVLADVCRVLTIAQPSSSARILDEDEKGVHTVHTPGGQQEVAIINESGLYSLILRSRKASAKRFKKWVTSEVLPTLRRTGVYIMKAGDPDFAALVDGRTFKRARLDVKTDMNLVNTANRVYGPDAARKVWEAMPWLPDLRDCAVGAVSGTASDDPVGCFRHLLRIASGNGRSIGDVLSLAIHDSAAAKGLKAFGLALDPPGGGGYLAIANEHSFLADAFAETQWKKGEWWLALAQLPGAKRSAFHHTFDGSRSRAVLIPRGEVLGLMHGPAG